MIHLFARIASYMLAFGFFFISCSTLSSTTDSASISKGLSEERLTQQLDSLNQQLEKGDNAADVYFHKGKVLAGLAQHQENPSERTSLYSDLANSISQAIDQYSNRTSEDKKEDAQEVLQVSWSKEHNQGVQMMQKDTLDQNPDYQRAAIHFKNATVIIPDSSISYQMEARAYYQLQDTAKAIETLERAQDSLKTLPLPLLEQLAYLYLENDQPEQAVTVYEEAESFSEQNLNLLHGLANAYMESEQHHEAVELLEILAESEPENILYGQSLATEIYHLASAKFDTARSDLSAGQDLQQTTYSEADSLLNQAETQYERLLEQNPGHIGLKQDFGLFYYNSGVLYQHLLSLVKPDQQQEIENQVQQNLKASIPLLSDVAEENNSPEIWETLYQIYSYLDMPEEAKNAKANY